MVNDFLLMHGTEIQLFWLIKSISNLITMCIIVMGIKYNDYVIVLSFFAHQNKE